MSAPRVLAWSEIESALQRVDLVSAIERAFVAYSSGQAHVPPPGELVFEEPPGEVHLKYGTVRGEPYYVVKVASGFYENPARGLPSGNGLMLLFSSETGEPLGVLLDEGRLTDARTAAAGAVAARHLAPPEVEQVGILGTGVQARLQLLYLRAELGITRALVLGRRPEAVDLYRREMEEAGLEIEAVGAAEELAERCALVVTTTPARGALLPASCARPGLHITAVGSDTPGKQELAPELLAQADCLVADSVAQCRERGELAIAVAAGLLSEDAAVELGAVVSGSAAGRSSPADFSVCDLTGVATQDLFAAAAVWEALSGA